MEALRVTASVATLFVVSTPIGNLGDISQRAIDTLRAADLILAEDTRHSGILLSKFGIRTRVESCHAHNEAAASKKALARLDAGGNVALITDAGTPLVSDPGARLIGAAIAAGVRVVPVPGPSAVLAALVASGLDASRFTFLGFLDRKGPGRKASIQMVLASPVTCVLFEAPGRVATLLAELSGAGGAHRPAVVARELTKQFEEYLRGSIAELAASCAAAPPRGEVVVLVGGAQPEAPDEAALRHRAVEMRAAGMSARETARVLSSEMGAPRNLAYRLAHE